ncbi:kinase-like domain-containing protein [Suillus lakei]|nr:kinase-like domain-containing protein [Suillus lakei]
MANHDLKYDRIKVEDSPDDLTPFITRTTLDHVGGGAFGDVWKCDYNADGISTFVAVKAFRCPEHCDLKKINRKIRREIGILKTLRHNNIVPLLGTTTGFGRRPELRCLVTPWIPNGTLNTYLASNPNLTMLARSRMANILIDEGGHARLIDFGLSTLVRPLLGQSYLAATSIQPGAIRYAAPELFLSDDVCDLPLEKTDIYSFGCVMFQILSGRHPWSEVKSEKPELRIVILMSQGRSPKRPNGHPVIIGTFKAVFTRRFRRRFQIRFRLSAENKLISTTCWFRSASTARTLKSGVIRLPNNLELLETRLAAAQNSAMAKANKCRPPKSRAKSAGTDTKENLNPHAAVTATADKRRILVAWSKPENHHLTDSLLTLIEESNTYRKAFGFALLPGSGKVASTGDQPANLYRQLATALFLDHEHSLWKDVDLNDLAETVKNRVANGLRKAFIKHRDSMSQTGQGLIDADREDEITFGSEIFNAWDQVKKKFPWYKRMNALYRESPAVDRSAVANSASQLDLTVLNCSQTTDDDEIPIEWPRSPTPEYTKDDDKSSIVFTPPSSPPNQPTTPASHAKPEPPSIRRASGQKRKTMHSHIEDLTTSLGESRVKVARVREREHTLRAQAKEDRKKAEFDSRLQFKAAEAERQRAHELAMLERQIELERLRAQPNFASSSSAGPRQSDPSHSGPSIPWAIDPSLY